MSRLDNCYWFVTNAHLFFNTGGRDYTLLLLLECGIGIVLQLQAVVLFLTCSLEHKDIQGFKGWLGFYGIKCS